MRRRHLAALALALTLGASAAGAQQGGGDGRPPARGGQRQPMDRRQLEQQIRRGFWRAAKDRIGFTDEQMQRLEQSSRKYDQRRRSLGDVERAQRLILREELVAPKGNQERVAAALDRLHDLQRQRLDLQGEEQRELATFMTPIQRARYAALQEQVRRRVESLRRARTDSMGPAMSLQG